MKISAIAVLLLFTLFSCKKSDDDNNRDSCYDSSIVHNNACLQDCPGITGCDGKFYCNSCIAAQAGIRPK